MMNMHSILRWALLIGVMTQVGCASMLHNMKPHRLRMLNRGPAPSLDPEFTSLDHLPEPRIVRGQR
jgi:hypothetical protein